MSKIGYTKRAKGQSLQNIEKNDNDIFSHLNQDNLNYIKKQLKNKKNYLEKDNHQRAKSESVKEQFGFTKLVNQVKESQQLNRQVQQLDSSTPVNQIHKTSDGNDDHSSGNFYQSGQKNNKKSFRKNYSHGITGNIQKPQTNYQKFSMKSPDQQSPQQSHRQTRNKRKYERISSMEAYLEKQSSKSKAQNQSFAGFLEQYIHDLKDQQKNEGNQSYYSNSQSEKNQYNNFKRFKNKQKMQENSQQKYGLSNFFSRRMRRQNSSKKNFKKKQVKESKLYLTEERIEQSLLFLIQELEKSFRKNQIQQDQIYTLETNFQAMEKDMKKLKIQFEKVLEDNQQLRMEVSEIKRTHKPYMPQPNEFYSQKPSLQKNAKKIQIKPLSSTYRQINETYSSENHEQFQKQYKKWKNHISNKYQRQERNRSNSYNNPLQHPLKNMNQQLNSRPVKEIEQQYQSFLRINQPL